MSFCFSCFPSFRIQITLVLVFIFSRYWSKSIIRAPPGPQESFMSNYLVFCGPIHGKTPKFWLIPFDYNYFLIPVGP